MLIKICGITELEDALAAVSLGADALGFVFFSGSPRAVTPAEVRDITRELPPFVSTVGVFVNEPPARINAIAAEAGLDVAQLHGDEPPGDCREIHPRVVKAFRVRDRGSVARVAEYPVSAVLLDAWTPDDYGGTGRFFDWDIASSLAARHRVILAGGLSPDNVREAISAVRPYAVDVSSGVERDGDKRRKDPGKIREFIRKARTAKSRNRE